MKEVFLMRHGRTLENVAHILTGRSDPPLSEEAREEIRSIRPYILRPDVVFSSDLIRASETARLLFPDHDIILLPHLRERDFNRLEGKPASVLRDTYQEDGKEGIFRIAGVETVSSMEARAEHVLRLIEEVGAHRVFVVSHGAFINCLVKVISPEIQTDRTLDNLHYHKYTLDDQGNIVGVEHHRDWLRKAT